MIFCELAPVCLYDIQAHKTIAPQRLVNVYVTSCSRCLFICGRQRAARLSGGFAVKCARFTFFVRVFGNQTCCNACLKLTCSTMRKDHKYCQIISNKEKVYLQTHTISCIFCTVVLQMRERERKESWCLFPMLPPTSRRIFAETLCMTRHYLLQHPGREFLSCC